MSKHHLPYYFEVPEIPMPPFNLDQFLIPEEDRVKAKEDTKTPDRIEGKTRTNLANWYQNFIPVESNSLHDKRNYNAVGMFEEANMDLSKLLKEWLHDTIDLKFTHVLMLRTPAGLSGRWHSEGPNFHDRRCALNFPMSGDFVNSKAQWATFPRFKNIDPIHNERMSHVTRADMEHTELLCEWTGQQPGFQNTMILHRGFNENSTVDRVILSASVDDFCDIDVVYKKYLKGKLFK